MWRKLNGYLHSFVIVHNPLLQLMAVRKADVVLPKIANLKTDKDFGEMICFCHILLDKNGDRRLEKRYRWQKMVY